MTEFTEESQIVNASEAIAMTEATEGNEIVNVTKAVKSAEAVTMTEGAEGADEGARKETVGGIELNALHGPVQHVS